MKAVQSIIVSNGVPYLQIMSVGVYSISAREKKGRKERMDNIQCSSTQPVVHGAMGSSKKKNFMPVYSTATVPV